MGCPQVCREDLLYAELELAPLLGEGMLQGGEHHDAVGTLNSLVGSPHSEDGDGSDHDLQRNRTPDLRERPTRGMHPFQRVSGLGLRKKSAQIRAMLRPATRKAAARGSTEAAKTTRAASGS